MKLTREEFLMKYQYIKTPLALGYILDRSELCKGIQKEKKWLYMLIYYELYHEVMQAHARLQDKKGFIRLKEVIEDIGDTVTETDKGDFLKRLIGCEWLFYSKPTDSANTDLIIQPVFDPERTKGFYRTASVVQACEDKDFTRLLMTVPNRLPEPKEN